MYRLVIFLLLIPIAALGSNLQNMLASVAVKKQSVVCAVETQNTTVETWHGLGNTTTNYRQGMKVDRTGGHTNVCQVGIYVNAITGSVSGKTLSIEKSALSGNDLTGSPTVLTTFAGADLVSSTWNYADVSPPVNVSQNEVISWTFNAVDASNYIAVGETQLGSTTPDWNGRMRWDNTGTNDVLNTTYEVGFKVYTQ